MINAESAATSEKRYIKVPNYPGLYRHTVSGRYYGVKKLHGRRKARSVGTTDWKIAERRMKEWVANLDKVDSKVEKTTLRQLLARYKAITQGRCRTPRSPIRRSSTTS